jgi:hypothetical protein
MWDPHANAKIALFKGSNPILKFQQVKRSLKLRSHKSLLDGEEYGRVSLRYTQINMC